KRPGKEVRIVLPPTHDLRRQRRSRPGVHHVRIANDPTRLPSLILLISGWNDCRGIERQLLLTGNDRVRVADVACFVHRVPPWKRDAKKPLGAENPITIQTVPPVLETSLHVRRMPLQLASAREERVAKFD